MITGNSQEFSYAEALKRARSNIFLQELDIDKTKIRKAANGGLLIEVLGPGGLTKANLIADKLRSILNEEARVIRPVIKREIRIIGFDESVSPKEIIHAIKKHKEAVRIRILRSALFVV